jgi:hypothetical protein
MIPASALFLSEAGAAGTSANSDVTVTLNPISFASSELQVSGNYNLTFNANNWNQPQQLRLQGVDDSTNDGDQPLSLRFSTSGTDPAYNGLAPSFQVTNVDNDATANNPGQSANTSGNGPLVSIAAPVPASLTEGSSSTSSFAVTLNQALSKDTVVYFSLDRKVGNALDNDVLIQPNAGSSTMGGLTLLGQLQPNGQLFSQVDIDGINETKATFASKGLTGSFASTWSGWVRIDQSGSYAFQTHMTGGSLSLIVNNTTLITGATVDNNSGPLNLTGGTFVPITLVFNTSSSTTADPVVSLSWTRPTRNGDSVTELLPANLLQRVDGRHVVIPAGSTSGGFNVSVVDDNVAEGVAGVNNWENLVLNMLDPLPVEIVVKAQNGSAQAASLTLGLGSSREESYTLAAGTVLPLLGDATVASTLKANFTLTQAVTLHRDLTTTASGSLKDPSGASYSGTMANLVNLASMVDATGTYNAIDASVSIQAINNWQPTNFSASSVGAFGLPVTQGAYASPTFVDIDADGDQDAFIGNNASILFYRNTGSASSAAFSTLSQGAFGLPATATGGLGYVQSISFVDIDGDGDQDAFIGSNSGTIQFFQNTGTKSVAAFAGSANAFGLTPIIGTSITAFADIDHDGDFDAFIGSQYGNVLFYRNTGNNTSPQFASASTNPFGITVVNGEAAPAFVDFDRDGDLDLFIGKEPNAMSDLVYFRNTGNGSSPAFATAVTNAFGLPQTDLRLARPAFVDIDADGNSDVFIGYNNGSTYFFQGNSSVDLALQATNRNSVTLPTGTVLSYPTPALTPGGTATSQNLNLTLKTALTLAAPSAGAATGTVHTASVGVSNDSGSSTVAAIQGLSSLVQISSLQLKLNDNDTAGTFISSDAAGTTAVSPAVIALSESGTSTDRWIRLTSQPTETVTVYLQTSDPTEVLLQPTSGGTGVTRLGLTFTVENWNTAQKFTLQPQNDALVDGTISLNITTTTLSSDPFYANLTGPALNVSVSDDDTAGLTRTLVTSTISQGSNGFLNLQLNAQPNADVTVTLTPSDSQFTVNDRGVGMAETIIFTPDDWSVERKVELKVVDDTAVEDITHSTLSFSASSSDSNFQWLSVSPVSIDIVDNDAPTASIQLVTNSTEEAAPGSFRIQLSHPAPSDSGSDGVVVNYAITALKLDAGLGYGDFDAFIGNQQGNTIFFRNNGNSSAPAFAGSAMSFGLTGVGFLASPTFVDIDADGDLDAFVGDGYTNGDIHYFKNTGTFAYAAFSTASIGAFGLRGGGGGQARPSFVDIDADGDLDAFIGSNNGLILFYRNTGTTQSASFAPSDVGSFDFQTQSGFGTTPSFADIDADGDPDAFIGNSTGNTIFFRNTGTRQSAAFASSSAGAFGLQAVTGNWAAPSFVDIDKDGDFDVFIGNSTGNTTFYRNTGSITYAAFGPASQGAFGLPNVGTYAAPTFVDIDGDYSSGTISKIVQTPVATGQVRIAPGSMFSDAFVVPIDDYFADSTDKQFSVTLSTGSGYQISSADPSSSASITILNNDKAGVAIITTGSRAGTTEGDTSATGGQFQVVLLSQPAANVIVTLTESSADSNPHLGSISSNGTVTAYSQSLTFTPDNWYSPQATTVYAYDDGKIAVQNGTGAGFEQEDPSRPYTGYQTAQIAYSFSSTDHNYNSSSNNSTHFTNSTLQTVDVMDRPLSANTDIAVNNSLIALQDGIESLALPMVGGLDGKVGSIFRGFLQNLVNSINISGTPTANELKKIIQDNIPPSNGIAPRVTLSMDGTDIRVQFLFNGQENLFSVPLATDLGTPALGFQANGSFDAEFGYTAQVTLVFDQNNGISLDTTPANTYVSASFDSGITDDFSMSGGLGMIQVTATNEVSKNPNIGSYNSGIDVTFDLDLHNSAGAGSDGRLTYTELTNSNTFQNLFEYSFTGDATLSMGVVSQDVKNATLPKVSFDMATHYALFDYSNEAEATSQANVRPIYFDNITLDLGSYITSTTKKTVDHINHILKPLYPIIDALNADTHIFKTLGIASKFDTNHDGKVTILEVANTYATLFPASVVTSNESDGHNLYTAITNTTDFLDKLTKVADLVRTLEDVYISGDLDLFVGNTAGSTLFFNNTGVSTDPGFSQTSNFGLPGVGTNASPLLADIDADGDLDAFIGDGAGSIYYYPNTGSSSHPSFDIASTTISHLLPFAVGTNASPTLVDIDSDGDLDLFVGNGSGNTLFYSNTTANKGYFDGNNFSSATTNPFGLSNVGSNASPNLVDIDSDGDLDAFIGNSAGNTLFFLNTGSAAKPAFRAASTNPFQLTDVGSNASPVFVDIEADGDLDAFIGNSAGNILFFLNTGSASTPAFASPSTNPFNIAKTSGNAKPFLADIDADNVFNINLGSYELAGLFSASHLDTNSTANVPVTSATTPGLQTDTASQANAGGRGVGNSPSNQLKGYMQKLRDLGFNLGIIDDPKNILKLLLNQDTVDIFSWTLPNPGLDFSIDEDFNIVEDLVDGLFLGDISLGATLGFGFDTYGLKEWRNSGFKPSEAWKVVDGFYVNDVHNGNQDLPEFTFSANVAAGLGLIFGIVRSDIIGGLLGTASFNLIDHPDASGRIDYKIRPTDFMGSQQELLSLFELDGDISAYLDARVDLGIDLGLVQSWTEVWEDQLTKVSIFSFDYSDGQLSTTGSLDVFKDIINDGEQAVDGAISAYNTVATTATNSYYTVAGTVSNGYINGGAAFWDGNYNNRIDASEPSATTTTGANFHLSLEPRSHDTNRDGRISDKEGHLVAMGGVDTSINQALKIPLLAPFGSMVTPLTTLHTLGLELGASGTKVKNWINKAFQLRGFNYLTADPVLNLNGQSSGISGGTDAQMAYLAHAKVTFAFDQLLTTLQSIEPLQLQNDLAKQLTLMSHVAKALFQLPPTTPINEALATALSTGTEAWLASLSPQLDDRNASIAREVARHASVTIQEFGRRHDQVAASFRDSDGPSFLAAINAVKSAGFGYFRSTMPGLTEDIQSFATTQAFLDTLHTRLVATEATYAAPGGVDTSGTGLTSDTANGTYSVGSVIKILVPFSEAVTVTGNPTLLLQTGDTQRSAIYSEGSGSPILSFTYTVQAGDTSADLDVASTTALQLNGGTIKDGFGDNATLTLPTPGGTGSLAANADLVIDALAPTLSGSNPADGAIGVLEAANIQLTFSEAVQAGTGSIQLLRADGSTVETFDVASGVGSAGGSLTINGTGVSLDPSASLLSNSAYSLTISPTALTDAAGNAFAGISDPTRFNFSTGDSIAPTISAVTSVNADGTYGTGARITLSLRFSEVVTVTGNGAFPSLLLETGTIDRSAIYNSGSGTDTLTFAYNVEVGDTSADLDYAAANALVLGGSTITDGAGNNATLSLPTPGAPGSLAANAALVISGTIPQSLSISTGTPAVSEGSSLSVALSSEGLAAGASIYWTASGDGITANDFSPSGLSGSLNLGSDLRAAFSRSISIDGISEGDEQLTLSFFSDANRTVSLGQALFTIRDLVPAGVAGATDGRDQITGSAADELISGVPVGSILNGRGSYDTLTGNGGNDTFILGTATTVYYNDAKSNTTGAADLAAITDFNSGDRIQLKGSAADYRLSSGALSGASGSFLHWRAAAGAGSSDETIGFIQGLTPAALSLSNSSQFVYL